MLHRPHPALRSRPTTRRWALLLLSLLTAIAVIAPTTGMAAALHGQVASPLASLTAPVAQAESFEQRGRALYTSGQFTQAIAAFQQALSAYETEGNSLRQAMTLSNLALTYWQLGAWAEANQAIDNSLTLLQALARSHRSDDETQRQRVLAQTLDIQGRLQLEQGQAEQALLTWQQAATVAEQLEDTTAVLRSQIHQSQALQALGLYRRAIDLLTSLEQTLAEQPASLEKTVGLRSLGEALQVGATLERAQQVLQSSLAIAEQLQLPEATSAAQLSLGNVLRAQGDREAALLRYQQAAAIAPLAITQTQAQLNQLSVLLDLGRTTEAERLITQLQVAVSQLPLSRSAIDAQVNFANSLIRLGSGEAAIENAPAVVEGVQRIEEGIEDGTRGRGAAGTQPDGQVTGSPRPQFYLQAAQVLAVAADQARQLGDRRAESYALGTLGSVYERMQQLGEAKMLTAQALLLSQSTNASDITYRWQWQLGRVLKAQWQDSATRSPVLQQEAISAYTEAVNTLQSIRSDLLAINPEIQFSFQGNIEPVYRELVGLLLEGNATPEQLEQARTVIESLQLAELDNFFREACLNAQEVEIDEIDRQAAVIYPIILEDRLEVILSIPQQPLRHYSQPVSSRDVEDSVIQLRRALTIRRVTSQLAPQTRRFYDWLIRPAAPDLEANGIQTLVFVLDGALRNVPMGALNDGEQYLIERYSIALTPGLQLLAPRPLQQQQFDVLAAGLTEARQGFSPLPGVVQELQKIQTEVPTRILLNQEFTEATFQDAVQAAPAQVIHLATHGNFSSNLEETFILTWDDRIDINQLNSLLQNTDLNRQEPIELLVLSACQTASGDRRAALGLAGMAVRSGARSTIASLWNVDDQATSQMMIHLYTELANAEVSKAEALRRAQLAVLQDPQYRRIPYFWAPFVLVGNWL